MMAAISSAFYGNKTLLLEKNRRLGKKLAGTGGGRCNVTNDCPAEEFLRHVRTNPRFLYSSLGAFPPAKTMELFEGLGVELKVERGRGSWGEEEGRGSEREAGGYDERREGGRGGEGMRGRGEEGQRQGGQQAGRGEHRGWHGDPKRHSEASRRGWEHRR